MVVNDNASLRVQNLPTALRAFVRGPIAWAAAGWLMAATAGAQAQDLPSTPLSWPASLPAAEPASLPLPAAEDGRTSFLKGRFLVGINLVHRLTPDDHIDSSWSVSPLFRTTPRTGWGPSFGLNWFTGDIVVSVGGKRTPIGKVRVRPIMAGVGYTIGSGRTRTTISLVGGYAFTSSKVAAALPDGATAAIGIADAWVVRPNVGVTIALAKRLALVGSLGYIYTTPTIDVRVTHPSRAAANISGVYRGDYVNVTVGTAVSIF